MAAGSASALALAAQLRALDDAELVSLIRTRDVRRGSIRDYFSLAEALLEPASLDAALRPLDRTTLAALAIAGDHAARGGTPSDPQLAETLGVDLRTVARTRESVGALGLIDRDSERLLPWDEVSEQLRGWPDQGLPGVAELLAEPAPADTLPAPAGDEQLRDRIAAERAFATVTSITELSSDLERTPLRRRAQGDLALPDARRLSSALALSPAEIERLLRFGEDAGMLRATPRAWVSTDAAAAWRMESRVRRWERLAAGWRARLPATIVPTLHDHSRAPWGQALLTRLAWRYPAYRDELRDLVVAITADAEQLGLATAGAPSSFGTTLLEEGAAAAANALAGSFPEEIELVYLQNDLTIVAPGPLAPHLEARLRQTADAEVRGTAGTFRVNSASVTRALVAGETADSLLSFFGDISLSGIPQPLDYLVRDTAARFGTLRVGESTVGGARASIRTSEPALRAQLLVDPRVAMLGLTPAPDGTLTTRLSRDVAYWTLVDARYPAVAEDPDGTIVDIDRVAAPIESANDTDSADALLARLRSVGGRGGGGGGEHAGTPNDGDWITRQLELAIRHRLAVSVRIRMPDGTERELVLEPAALAGGRVRARDRRADLERTLPLSHIVEVTPAE